MGEEQKFLDDLTKNQDVTRAISKVTKKSMPVNVYRHGSLVKNIKEDLAKIPTLLKEADDPESKKKLEEAKTQREEALAKEEKDRIVGILTPLTYRDMNDIKAAVTEALLHFNDYNFDPEVKLARVVAEERYMAVFCALKRPENHSLKYFSSLEEIAQLDDETVFELYDLWFKTFVLTEAELKNS